MMLSKQLRIALLMSFLWHVVLLCIFSLVFSKGNFRFNLQPEVVFLGSILRRHLMADVSNVALPKGAELKSPSRFKDRAQVKYTSEKGIIDVERFIDVDFARGEFAKSFASLKSSSTSLREIIFKPDFSGYPEWEQEESTFAAVEFKIFISSEGMVEQVVAMRASGNPEIDAALARYIRRWRFAPAVEAKGEWQRVTLNLTFERATPLLIEFKRAEG